MKVSLQATHNPGAQGIAWRFAFTHFLALISDCSCIISLYKMAFVSSSLHPSKDDEESGSSPAPQCKPLSWAWMHLSWINRVLISEQESLRSEWDTLIPWPTDLRVEWTDSSKRVNSRYYQNEGERLWKRNTKLHCTVASPTLELITKGLVKMKILIL